jgi:hypothetical protein
LIGAGAITIALCISPVFSFFDSTAGARCSSVAVAVCSSVLVSAAHPIATLVDSEANAIKTRLRFMILLQFGGAAVECNG